MFKMVSLDVLEKQLTVRIHIKEALPGN